MKARPTLLLILAAFCCASVQADVVTLGADKDTSIFANNVNNSAGGGPALFAGTNGANSVRRTLLSFDLGGIPAGSTITNVQLTLTLGQIATGATTATIGLFGLTQDWGEGTTGSEATGISGSGQGFAANTGDATWNAGFYSAITPTLWTNPGGDHAAIASASLFLATNVINTAFAWPSTPQLVADVQGWLDNPATNFGWELINANETTAGSLFGFYSSEWDTFPGGLSSREPALQVTYTVPEPSAAALLAGVGILWAARRHRHAPAA